MTTKIKGTTALVTGANRGIGRAITEALLDRIFAPCTAAPTTAAYAAFFMMGHLHQCQSRNALQNASRRFVDAVVASQIARIVVGHQSIDSLHGF